MIEKPASTDMSWLNCNVDNEQCRNGYGNLADTAEFNRYDHFDFFDRFDPPSPEREFHCVFIFFAFFFHTFRRFGDARGFYWEGEALVRGRKSGLLSIYTTMIYLINVYLRLKRYIFVQKYIRTPFLRYTKMYFS